MYSLAAFRQIEEGMENYMLPESIYTIIEVLTVKVGGSATSVPKQAKESLLTLLNKLTNDTYSTISTKILTASPTSETLTDVFKVAANNMFYSKLYARLCHQIVNKNEALRPCILEKCTTYIDSSLEVTSKQRSMTVFVTNLALNGTIPTSECVRLVYKFQTQIEANTDGDEDIVSEWVEHLALILTSNKTIMDTCSLEPRIQSIVELDPKKHKGITLKIIFKYMDVLEHFK